MAFELAKYDNDLSRKVILTVSGTPVYFQFPPKITSENKSSGWNSVDLMSWEPLKIYSGSSARSLSLEAEYIVGVGGWSGKEIAQTLRILKYYFYNAKVGFGESTTYAVVQLQAYEIIPEKANFRMMDFSVEYGNDSIVTIGDKGYPLYSKFHATLELVTQLKFQAGGEGAPSDPGKEKAIINAKPLQPLNVEWY